MGSIEGILLSKTLTQKNHDEKITYMDNWGQSDFKCRVQLDCNIFSPKLGYVKEGIVKFGVNRRSFTVKNPYTKEL